MKQLSKAEEKVLHIIWEQEPTYSKNILEAFPDPKPAKTTVATVLKRMIDKGYVAYDASGGNRHYRSLISKKGYLKTKLTSLISNFFDSDPAQFASFFAGEMDLSLQELDDVKKLIDSTHKTKKS
ncbi:MAG: BlaI family penicillinase repressor [Saprospiraceae bacterium]|jgi:BlaI family penicillinase repressor